ncbi:MAG: PIN domain-containing protein [Firmicutes bacterium]|nr:PIN domain-containing protein [Bacillota bacterium]
MVLIDANVILRSLLNDNAEMMAKVGHLISKTKVFVRYEVLAEVIYVLEKVYKMEKKDILANINVFLNHKNVTTENAPVLQLALKTYGEKNLDFVDCILYAFKAILGVNVFTFDKKLDNLIKEIL